MSGLADVGGVGGRAYWSGERGPSERGGRHGKGRRARKGSRTMVEEPAPGQPGHQSTELGPGPQTHRHCNLRRGGEEQGCLLKGHGQEAGGSQRDSRWDGRARPPEEMEGGGKPWKECSLQTLNPAGTDELGNPEGSETEEPLAGLSEISSSKPAPPDTVYISGDTALTPSARHPGRPVPSRAVNHNKQTVAAVGRA
ncbi:hypothetical protein AAFF_G00217450 [Aldrovandia affinis]|uniref:Uncharacterized protein n=1 Tax=Aldrovandia affinis TaxID=143900 RepID=A0AAD7SXL0_9TELE|nr:hypothetical protein AAFF_G00217450 [Aldrovandia affinis]